MQDKVLKAEIVRKKVSPSNGCSGCFFQFRDDCLPCSSFTGEKRDYYIFKVEFKKEACSNPEGSC